MLSGDCPATGRPDDDQIWSPSCIPARGPICDEAGWKQITTILTGSTWQDNSSTADR